MTERVGPPPTAPHPRTTARRSAMTVGQYPRSAAPGYPPTVRQPGPPPVGPPPHARSHGRRGAEAPPPRAQLDARRARRPRAAAGAGLRGRLDDLQGARDQRPGHRPDRHLQLRGRRADRGRPAQGQQRQQHQPQHRHDRQGARARPPGRAGRGRPHLLLQQRLRPGGHRARGLQPAHRRRRRRIDDHPAVREGVHRPGPGVPVAQVQGDHRLDQDLQGTDQGPDPRELPQHRVLRPRRLRHPGGGAGLLPQGRRASSRSPRARCSPG